MNTKKCSCCQKYKSIDEFYRCPTRYDGLRVYCKKCQSMKNKENKEYFRLYANNRYKNDVQFRENIKKNRIVYRQGNQEKIKAHNKVARALSSGKLQKKVCVICGKTAVAHHPDYNQPLNVIWVCHRHHKEIHI